MSAHEVDTATSAASKHAVAATANREPRTACTRVPTSSLLIAHMSTDDVTLDT